MGGVSQPESGPSRRPSARRGLSDSLGDMVRSVVVLLGLVLVIVFIGNFLFGRDGGDRPTVEWQQPLAQAREASTFPVWAPPSLPEGWRATTVSYDSGQNGRWHLGAQTDDDDYVGLEVSPVGERRLIERYSGSTSEDGTVQVDGQTWTRWTGDDENSLVRTVDGTTILVTGTAPADVISSYAATLTTG